MIDYNCEVKLDEDSLLCVFYLLDVKDKQNAAQVCKYWKEVVYVPALWKNVTVTLRNIDYSLATSLEQRKITRIVCRGSTDEDLAILFNSNYNHITSLKIDGCRQVTLQFLQQNLATLNKLVSLHITRCPIDIELLFQGISLTGLLSRLKSVSLPKLSSSNFQEVIQKLPSLEEIDDDYCLPYTDTDDCMKILVKACPKLQRISRFGLYTGSRLGYEAWKIILEGLHHLKAIELCLYTLNVDGDDAILLKLIADNLPNLESLKTASLELNDEVIDAVKRLKNLKEFSFTIHVDAYMYDDDSLSQREEKLLHEISKMTQLQSLKVILSNMKFTGAAIYSLVECMSKLRSLEIGPIASISGDYADLIGERLTKLQSLKLIAGRDVAGIGALCSHLTNLTDLNIIHGGLLNRDIKEITSVPSKLKSLNVAKSTKIRDQGLTFIANGLKSLTSLDISSCSVSNNGLFVISEELKHLQRLSVTGRKITNQGAIMIGKHLKGLEKLKISGTKISDQGFAFVCQELPKLRTLQAFCDLLTDQGFSQGAIGLGKLRTLQIGSHRIRATAIQDSLKHLESVEHCTLRSIKVSDAFIECMVKEMPCLADLQIYHCRHSNFYNETSYELCLKYGINFHSGRHSCIKLPYPSPKD